MTISNKELERRTKQRLKKTFSIKQLKKDTKEKKQYLSYFKKTKKEGKRPMRWGRYKLTKGLSRHTRGQLSGLSSGDYAEVQKLLRKK